MSERARQSVVPLVDRGLNAPDFDGTGPRYWVIQMRYYYAAIRADGATRLKDASLRLTGRARAFYFALDRSCPRRLSTALEQLLRSRFNASTVYDTVRKLRKIRWRGRVVEVNAKFADVLVEGEELSEPYLTKLYLSRFPISIVMRAG